MAIFGVYYERSLTLRGTLRKIVLFIFVLLFLLAFGITLSAGQGLPPTLPRPPKTASPFPTGAVIIKPPAFNYYLPEVKNGHGLSFWPTGE